MIGIGGGSAYDQSHRLPFANQVCDGREAPATVLKRDALQRMRDADCEIPDGDADALSAVVERENRAGISWHPRAGYSVPEGERVSGMTGLLGKAGEIYAQQLHRRG